MRPPPAPIRHVFRGTEYNRKSPPRYKSQISPSISSLLSRPTWSVRSLLPTTTTSSEPAPTDPELPLSKVEHLLRLSALPMPKKPADQATLQRTLRSQIQFVRNVQSVDTTGVEPLVTIRDETREAIAEQTIGLETMRPYLELEREVGRNGTVRRMEVQRTEEEDRSERQKWEVDVGDLGVGSAERRVRGYFYVKRVKGKKAVVEEGGGRRVVGDEEGQRKGEGQLGEKRVGS